MDLMTYIQMDHQLCTEDTTVYQTFCKLLSEFIFFFSFYLQNGTMS